MKQNICHHALIRKVELATDYGQYYITYIEYTQCGHYWTEFKEIDFKGYKDVAVEPVTK